MTVMTVTARYRKNPDTLFAEVLDFDMLKRDLGGLVDYHGLPKGHAFALIAGRLYKLRLPLFSDDAELPSGLQTMVDAMCRDYVHGNVEGWADTSPLGWQS